MSSSIRFAVLTSSDSGFAGSREDIGGDAVINTMNAQGHSLVQRALEPDDESRLVNRLSEWIQDDEIQLILSTGGTGLGPRDLMPQATAKVIEYEVPGMSEAMRAASLQVTAMAMISRSIAGVANRTMIVNLPGNPKGAVETLEVVIPVLPHAIALLRDAHTGDHPIDIKHH